MSRAAFGSLIVFLLFATGGLALFFFIRPVILGIAAFLVMGMTGGSLASRVFTQLATPEDKRRDLEDRVRNSDL
jgi:hypothetical protein